MESLGIGLISYRTIKKQEFESGWIFNNFFLMVELILRAFHLTNKYD